MSLPYCPCAHVDSAGKATISRLPGRLGDAGSCERPSRLYCSMCRQWTGKRCESGRSSQCQSCAVVKLGDLRAIARSGIPDSLVGLVALVTLTGPGKRLLPWDVEVCRHAPDVVCSGPLGCRVERVPAAAWHASMPRRWSDFVTYLRRMVGAVEYFKVYEWQQRGVLHVHALVRLEPGVSGKRFEQAVRLCSHRWGFGKPDVRWLPAGDVPTDVWADKPPARNPRACAAGYVAKYVTKGYEDLGDVLVLDVDSGQLHRRCVRPWSSSRTWGDTMRSCRERRRSYWGAGTPVCGAAAAGGSPSGGAAALDPYWNRSTTAAPLAFDHLLAASPM
jgi:hypothetical protein